MARRRYQEEHEPHDRWLVSYADFITLMFALFVVMYSVSSVNDGKYRVLSESLEKIFAAADVSQLPPGAGEGIRDTQFGLFDTSPRPPGNVPTIDAALSELEQAAVDVVMPGEGGRAGAAEQMQKALQSLSQRDDVRVRRVGDRIEVELDNRLLFASAEARIRPAGIEVLQQLAGTLAGAPSVRVEGHTDDRPIATLQFASNWSLSAARAASVVDVLAGFGLPPARMAATGFGEFRPLADNATEEGRARNRRVVIVAGMEDADSPVDAGTTSDQAVPGQARDGTAPGELEVRRVLKLPGPRVLR